MARLRPLPRGAAPECRLRPGSSAGPAAVRAPAAGASGQRWRALERRPAATASRAVGDCRRHRAAAALALAAALLPLRGGGAVWMARGHAWRRRGPDGGRACVAGARAAARDPYTVLGMPAGSSKADVRKRFRRLAQTQHPDVKRDDPQAAERFQELTAAYNRIMGAEARAADAAPPGWAEEGFRSSAESEGKYYRWGPSSSSRRGDAAPDGSEAPWARQASTGPGPGGATPQRNGQAGNIGYFVAVGAGLVALVAVAFVVVQKAYCMIDPGEAFCYDDPGLDLDLVFY